GNQLHRLQLLEADGLRIHRGRYGGHMGEWINFPLGRRNARHNADGAPSIGRGYRRIHSSCQDDDAGDQDRGAPEEHDLLLVHLLPLYLSLNPGSRAADPAISGRSVYLTGINAGLYNREYKFSVAR